MRFNLTFVCIITISVISFLAQQNMNLDAQKEKKASHLIGCIHFSKDGKELYCSCSDGTIRIINPATGEHSAIKTRFISLWTYSISPESKQIAIGDGKVIYVIDYKTHARLCSLSGHSASIASLIFPNEDTLFSGSTDGSVRFWDIKRKEMKGKLLDQAYEVLTLACTSNAEFLAAGDPQGMVTIWKKPFDKILVRYPAQQGIVSSLGFSKDNKKLISAGSSNVTVWDFPKAKSEFTLEGHAGPVISLAVANDGEIIATGSSRDNTVFVWNIKTGAEVAHFKLPNYPNSLAFSPDGKTLVVGTLETSLHFYDTLKWQRSKVLKLN
jgi:WD40 repeat protein